jgi:hypothetical protein
MLFTIIGSVVFVVLVLAALPLAAVRQFLLMLMHRLLHLGVLAGVLACAALFYLPPENVPSAIQTPAHQLDDMLDIVWPIQGNYTGRLWLALAVTLTCVMLPVLMFLDCVVRLTRHTRRVEREERDKAEAASKGVKLDRPAPRRLGDLLEKSSV